MENSRMRSSGSLILIACFGCFAPIYASGSWPEDAQEGVADVLQPFELSIVVKQVDYSQLKPIINSMSPYGENQYYQSIREHAALAILPTQDEEKLLVDAAVLAVIVVSDSLRGEGSCYVSSVNVDFSYRRFGLAFYLMKQSFHWMQNLFQPVVTNVLLEVRENNTPAVRLYSSLGFKQISANSGGYATDLLMELDGLNVERVDFPKHATIRPNGVEVEVIDVAKQNSTSMQRSALVSLLDKYPWKGKKSWNPIGELPLFGVFPKQNQEEPTDPIASVYVEEHDRKGKSTYIVTWIRVADGYTSHSVTAWFVTNYLEPWAQVWMQGKEKKGKVAVLAVLVPMADGRTLQALSTDGYHVGGVVNDKYDPCFLNADKAGSENQRLKEALTSAGKFIPYHRWAKALAQHELRADDIKKRVYNGRIERLFKSVIDFYVMTKEVIKDA